MASIERRSGKYRIVFRHGGRKYQTTLKTTARDEAETTRFRVEENLRLLERGILVCPPGADLAVFLLTDGKLNSKPVITTPLLLGELFRQYREGLPEGVKEENTRCTENIHMDHLCRVLGKRTPVGSISTETLQGYVDARSKEDGQRGKKVSHATVRKEIGTFAAIWNRWGAPQGLVVGVAPTKGLIYRKGKSKPPFQTWEQVERQVARGGLTHSEVSDLWDCLFLSLGEISDFLDFVKVHARHQFVYIMFAMASHLGCRRSEILRSQIDDFDFQSGLVIIREKKRDRSKELTYRHVPISPFLRETMMGWLGQHPGGRYTVCETADVPITVQLAAHHFRWTVDGSKWGKLRGWHVLRHSFCSNCAAKGVDARIIDTWVGHQTEAMRRRYRHLFPDQQHQAISLVFGNESPQRRLPK